VRVADCVGNLEHRLTPVIRYRVVNRMYAGHCAIICSLIASESEDCS
jgi:hypothetical protein